MDDNEYVFCDIFVLLYICIYIGVWDWSGDVEGW